MSMSNDLNTDRFPKAALVQRGGGTYSVAPRVALGQITPEQLNIINDVVQEYKLPGVRLTAGQKMKIQGIPEDKVLEVIERLGPVGEFCKYYVQTCPGNRTCKFGMQDSIGFGQQLEEYLNEFELPSKLKVGISGCSMCCSESYVRDVGLIGKKKGWTVVFGGNAGKRVRKGDVLAENLSDQQALECIGKVLNLYADKAKPKERTARFIERVGIETVKTAL